MLKKLIAAVLLVWLLPGSASAEQKPNIIFLICDDLGYGDIHCLAPETSKIPTPNADKLASQGMVFTDAHSGSSVCSPTRYGIMTGRYSWRTRLQKGVVTGYAPSLIAEDRPTVAGFLREQGYTTGVVGKWHLDFQYLDPKTGDAYAQKDHKSPPIGAKIPDGPLHRGFDYYHGFHHARNMEAVIENDQVVEHDPVINMLPRLTKKSVEFIDAHAGDRQPFFLYVPLGSPHTPIAPTAEWQGKSGLGPYGDFVMQTDNVLGEISNALEKHDIADNTLVIFTSDNGCSKAAGIGKLAAQGHKVSAHLRGSKADIWDGGHRIPFIVRWPGKVKPGTQSDQLICLTDFFATAGELLGSEVPSNSCEDSASFLPVLFGKKMEAVRAGVIHHSFSGHFAYRQGPWKLLLARASGGWTSPKEGEAPKDGPKAQLYNMQADPGETNNLYLEQPETAEKLLAQLKKEILGGRSTLGTSSQNDVDEIVLWKSEQGPRKKTNRKANKKSGKKTGSQLKASTKQVAAPAKAKRPNILFIIADDQSPFELKTYNSKSTLETPVIDRLALEGLVFDGAYHMGSFSGAVCSPSRHMVMTGRTVWHLGGRRPANRLERQRQAAAKAILAENSMAAIFNRAGYDTMRTCKKGNSFAGANAKFTVVHDATKRGGTAESGSEWHADQVLNYLKQRDETKDEDPFLIYLGFSHPHDPRTGPDDLLKKYAAVNHKDKDNPPRLNSKSPALPSNYLPGHPFPDGHPNLRDEVSVTGVWKRRDEATIRNEIGRQYACSDNIDMQIGRVLKKLEDMGELDNTYIIYTADHGMAIGRHGLQGKQNLYEHTWRVPFIVKGPDVTPGRVQGNIYLLDVLGTMCDLADISPPESIESESFLPVIEGTKTKSRDVLYGVYCGGTKPGMRSVRKGDWKLIKYDTLDGKVRETQLFNLKENPHEYLQQHHAADVMKLTGVQPEPHQVDLAEDPKYAAKLAEMEALLLAEMKRLDDPYRLWDQPAE